MSKESDKKKVKDKMMNIILDKTKKDLCPPLNINSEIKKMIKLCRCTQCGNSLDVETLCEIIASDSAKAERERLLKELPEITAGPIPDIFDTAYTGGWNGCLEEIKKIIK